MAGYTRQSSAEIADTLTIEAVDLNNEFDKLVAVFNNGPGVGGGHKHDGTAAEGPVIELIGDAGLTTPLNKILVDTTNKHIEFYTDVSSAAVQQVRIQDGAIVPILDNDIDLGTASLEFKDIHIDGTANIDTLVIGTSTGVTSVDTDLTSASASDDTLASAKAIKTYVDAVPVGDLTAIVAGSGLTGTSLSGPIPTLNVIGGNGITANADELVIDTAITVDKTTAQILTNKTLTTPTIASILNTGTITLPTSTDTLVGKATTDVLTNKTLTSPVLNIGISGTAFKDEDTMSSDSATAVSSQQSIKAYIATQVSVGDITSVVAGTGLTDGGTSGDVTLNVVGGTGITANADDIAIDSSVVTLTDTQALSAKTLTSPVLNTAISGTAFLDEDDFASDSATKVASQQSIKAYVDAQEHSVTPSSTTIFTNKSIDSDNNTITNIVNADIKAAAAIDASKIADGSVSNAEFQRLDGLTSDIQTQLDLKATLASPDFTGNPTAPTQSAADNSTKLATTAYVDNSTAARDQLGEMTDVTLSGLADANYFIYDNAASVWKNKAISGAFTSNNLGVTTLASGIDATKIADGSVTDTEFQYINTLSDNAQTQIDTKATAGFAVAMAIAL